MIGQSIAHYRVTSLLGAGGMGEVYRATDSKLGRDVALKVLPAAFAQDAERMARFQREAQVLASLNHTNIASIYGLEESGGVRALVMELVEGPTLAEKIKQGALPIEEALQTAKQIAEALEAAHEKGIIHRDLKPANVKITPDGKVKVLDFGLAKALEGDMAQMEASNSPTISMAATKMGMILGTAAYMSPEQAKGKTADRRADIWAFGVVLHEMLTGKQLYSGETPSEILAAVMLKEPAWDTLPANTPPRVRQLLRRCLTKDPRRRMQAIGEARVLIEDEFGGAAEPMTVAVAETVPRRRPLTGLLTAVGITAVVTSAVFLLIQPRAPEPPVRRFAIPVPDLRLGIQTPPVISPDGKKIAYVAGASLWIRELDRMEAREAVVGVSPQYPFWSPDSSQVAYLAEQKIWRVGVSGGQPATVAPASFNVGGSTPGGAWTQDGKIIFVQAANGTGILSVSDQGGDLKEFLAREEKSESDFHKPSVLPGGKGLLFIVDRNEGGADTIEAWTGQARKTILQLKGEYLDAPVYSPTGHIFYRRNTGNPGIWAVPFALQELKTTGEPFLVVGDGSWPSVSSDGTLLYSDEGESLRQAVLLNRKGEVESALGEPKTWVRHPRFSPEGSRVALYEGGQIASGIFVTDLRRKTDVRLTFDSRLNFHPAWRGGDRVFYESREGGAPPDIFARSADGSGKEELIVKEALQPNVSPDGKWLVYSAIMPNQGAELFYMPLEGDRKPVAFLQAPGNQWQPVFSPDGRYVAYESNDSGRYEILLKAFPAGEGKWQVSTNGGVTARWERSGKKLYYVQGETLMEVNVSTQPKLVLGTPHALFSGAPKGLRMDFWYDVSPDGKTLVAVQEAMGNKAVVHSLRVVENWYAEFKDKQRK